MNKHKKAFYSRDPKAYPLMKVLEPRIMFDGAAIFSGLDALDSLEAQKNNLDQTDISQQSLDNNQSLFSANVSTSKDFVFIDKGVNDYESLVHSIGSSKQIFIIDSNKDGFIEIQNILQGKSNLDSVHLIGHGSAGQIIFGNTTLSSENLNQYTDALRVIGSALTTSGDILFYGCNIAQTETGELLIQQIGNITQADIAASTDLTGKNGDWDLEHKIGSIESESLVFEEFNGTLDSYGVDSINSNVVAIHNATNFKAQWSNGSGNNGGQLDSSSDRFIITMERQNITNSGGTLVFDQAGTNSTYTASSTNKINSYLIYLNDETNRRSSANAGSVTFDNDILGYYTAWSSTIDNNYLDKSGATYPTSSATKVSKRIFESFTTSQTSSRDWAYLTGDKTITFGANNGQKGDFIRVITKAAASNTAPVASYDYAVINEDASFSVSDGAGENKVGYYDSSGENTGDILDSDNSSYDDTDADGDSLTITSVRIGRVENSGTAGTLGQALTGTYGQLTLNANGSYSYSANQNAADTLDSGDSVYDYFNYTVSDGTDTDSAVIRIQVKGINDDITAVNDFDAVNEDATITRSASSSYSVDYDDTDADGDDNYTNFTITAIKTGITEGSGTAGTVGQALTGTYGTLTLNSNGSYSYTADQSAADDLDSGDTAYDYFNYTVSDGTDTDIAVLRITVTGINDAPVAQNDVGVINEDATLTVSNSANANVSGSYDATGEHSGDVINTSSSSHTDSDPDDSASLVVSAIRLGSSEGSGTAGTLGSALTGTYGTLTMNANGSYTYVADQAAADNLNAGQSATDSFNYTLSDGTATDIGVIQITVLGLNNDSSNAAPSATNDTDAVNANETITRSDGSSQDVQRDDTDSDGDTLTVSAIRTGAESGSGTSGSVGSALTGTYGQLTLNANGSYSYVADQDAADSISDGATATDTFTYTITDGDKTDTAEIVITVTGTNFVAVNDTDSVNEDATVTATDGSSTDVITDDSGSGTLVVSAIRLGGSEGSGTAGTVGSALTGTYGTLTLNADGSYTYVADQAAADALDAGDTVTDSFNYTVTSGSQTDTATLVFTVTGINDPVVAVNDTDAVTEDATISRSVGDDQELDGDDTDSDASSSSTITNIRTGATEGSGTEGTIGSGLVGTYGTLTVNADGSYTYVADQQASDELGAGVSATDSFNYTVSDGTSTDTATLVITVTGTDPKNNPIAADDTGSVIEGNTLTVSDGDSDLIAANDTDADTATSSLTISGIRTGSESGTGTTGTVGTALVGTYGTLTVNANGSYTYVANTDSAKEIAPGSSEVDKFTYTLTDGVDTDTAQISFTVTGINNPPTVTPIGVVSVLETQKIKLDTTTFFNDPDPSINNYGQLVYSTTGLPSQLSIDEDTGLITGTFGGDEYGTYTFTITGTDGGNLSTQTTVTIHVRKPTPEIDDNVKVNKKTGEFKKVKIKAKNIEKLNLRAEARVQNFSSNYSAPEIVRDLSFSGGLKVVDVGAEVMNTKLVPNQEGVTVGFSIADDYKQNVKQYTGVMKDGSALPDWIKVDPNNGQTLTQFPEGIEAIEIKIIAIEKDNTARNINVVLDKAKIEADPFLQKDLDKFFDRSATLKTLVEVDNQGQVNLQRQTDNEIDQTLTSNLNTPLNDSMRTPDVFFQEGFEPQATFKISNMENTTTGYKIDIIDDSRDTVKQYSASFANGTPLPQWISINPISGLIEANPPSGIEKISFKVLAEDDDGDTRVLDVELDFTSNDELSSLIPQDQESIQSISPLSDQLFSEYNKYENYGSKLIDRINA